MDSTAKPCKKTWPILAHLAVLIAAPFWVMICVFSFLLFANQADPPLTVYLVFALYWLGPIATLVMMLMLWHALIRGRGAFAQRLSWILIAVQLMAGVLLGIG